VRGCRDLACQDNTSPHSSFFSSVVPNFLQPAQLSSVGFFIIPSFDAEFYSPLAFLLLTECQGHEKYTRPSTGFEVTLLACSHFIPRFGSDWRHREGISGPGQSQTSGLSARPD
jgi:hypothetical protein